ncbi:unnamed protein product [Owenia fusiformis]|uniref:B-related factor 1 n=1 Tax=Owenia fusiformis TaxID=6347 RepID=A0A8S4PC75_OWEFU|nr:unnamed protein product [Owenia fusiformis]
MSSRACSHCGCSDIDTDPARGDAVCTGCGSVLEDQIIVSEVQFEENRLGGASVIGQFVSSEGNKGHSMGSGFHHGFGKESRAITLQNGKRKIQQLGGQLRLNSHCIDTAYNFFKMAVSRRLTRGRKTTHVVAACLYLVCRTEGTPHMLLDFSDQLQVNVYTLGRTYLQLSRELCINVPAIDPCLLIPRFAHKLEFEDKTHEVSMTALRLVSRMKRDWMGLGRRPSGLCGAALFVAARVHDFDRTMKEIIKVVKVCEGTLRKRLNEFEMTASSQLTIDEFHKIDLEEEADPPAFTQGKLKAKLALFDEQNKMHELTEEIETVQNQIEFALESPKKRGRNNDDMSSICSSTPSISDFDDELSQCSKDAVSNIKEVISDSEAKLDSIINENNFCDDTKLNKLDSVLMPPPKLEEPLTPRQLLGPAPTAASLGLNQSIEECMAPGIEKDIPEDEGILDMTDIDDEELDRFILNPKEVQIKTEIWTSANADYLKELKEKEEREAREKELNKDKPENLKKKKKYKKKQPIQASTAREAIEKILQEKKISSKINYDVLKDLNKGLDKKPITEETPEMSIFGSPGLSLEATPVHLKSSLSEKRIRRSSISQDEPLPKKPNIEEIVVESGPVQYENVEDDAEQDEDEVDEFEKDAEEPLSAAQLLGHGEYQEVYDEIY